MLEYETVNCAASRSVVSGTSFPSVLITTAGEPDTWAWKKISFFWRYFFTISSLLWASLPPTTRNPSDEKNHLNCSNHFCFGFWIFLLILGVSFFPVQFFVCCLYHFDGFIFLFHFTAEIFIKRLIESAKRYFLVFLVSGNRKRKYIYLYPIFQDDLRFEFRTQRFKNISQCILQ